MCIFRNLEVARPNIEVFGEGTEVWLGRKPVKDEGKKERRGADEWVMIACRVVRFRGE